ncbi:uncharacterized protein LOC130050166 [Ostrea edulis]|uniref:uncharacterized protein LOC130050166 n=1 Tax=Ostrea edulis TaxID=37623 RepID=UPI0024AF64B0|nr:uncharacterized protein LOC130050166 [Ostrea edulis]
MTWTTYEPRNFHIRVACETGVYLCVDRNITCVYGYPIRERREMSLFKFGVRFFKCKAMDSKRRYQAYFGCVFIFEDEGQLFDISSTLGEESAAVILKPHTAFSLDSPDERFFLMHGIEDGDDMFESLNYENMCMKIEISSQKIVMQYLGISNPVTKKSFKITKPSFKFQTFSIKAAKELMESYPGHQKKSKGRGLLFLCFGIGASFDISNVPCLEWSSFALEAINSSVRKSIYLK